MAERLLDKAVIDAQKPTSGFEAEHSGRRNTSFHDMASQPDRLPDSRYVCIARPLLCSPETVQRHLERLQCRHPAELTSGVIANGLLGIDSQERIFSNSRRTSTASTGRNPRAVVPVLLPV